MKKIFVIFLLITSLTSCFGNNEEKKLDNEEKKVINNEIPYTKVQEKGVSGGVSEEVVDGEAIPLKEVIDIPTDTGSSTGTIELEEPTVQLEAL